MIKHPKNTLILKDIIQTSPEVTYIPRQFYISSLFLKTLYINYG